METTERTNAPAKPTNGAQPEAAKRATRAKRAARIRSLMADEGYSRREATALVDGGF